MDYGFLAELTQSIAIIVLAIAYYKMLKEIDLLAQSNKLLSSYLNDSHTAVERMANLMIEQRKER